MSKELENAVVTLIEKSIKAVEVGADFLSAEIPEVVNQLLLWYAVKSGITFIVCSAVIFLCFYFIVRKVKNSMVDSEYNVIDYLGVTLYHPEDVLYVLIIIPIIIAFYKIDLDWLKILIAPKLFLLEYATSLVK